MKKKNVVCAVELGILITGQLASSEVSKQVLNSISTRTGCSHSKERSTNK